jgi:hypothetical protein
MFQGPVNATDGTISFVSNWNSGKYRFLPNRITVTYKVKPE